MWIQKNKGRQKWACSVIGQLKYTPGEVGQGRRLVTTVQVMIVLQEGHGGQHGNEDGWIDTYRKIRGNIGLQFTAGKLGRRKIQQPAGKVFFPEQRRHCKEAKVYNQI